MNTEVADTGNNGSVASNKITLAAGTYRFHISAPALYVNVHQARLQNVTDGTTVKVGSSEYSIQSGFSIIASRSIIVGRFTIAGTKDFEIQHQCQTTQATNGYGNAANFTTEVYTQAEFWKE